MGNAGEPTQPSVEELMELLSAVKIEDIEEGEKELDAEAQAEGSIDLDLSILREGLTKVLEITLGIYT